MKLKPEHISQADWDAVNVPDMGDTPFQGIKTDGRSPADIAAAIKRRGKQKAATKVSTTMRLPADVLEYFKAEGKGWQTRISDVLSDYVSNHR